MCNEFREELEKLIKEEYKIRKGKEYASSKVLPTCFKYYRNKKVLFLTIEKVTENMQKNYGAFDSWALVIKNWIKEIEEIILIWERPDDIYNPHYQRFLYRMKSATTIYKWLKVETSCQPKLDDLMIKPGNDYIVNVPLSEAKENANNSEAKIERIFIKCYKDILAKAANMDNTIFYNQLPVGLFKDDINKKNRIFPSSNAMIDIWGINQKENELHIFELKNPNECPIGIYSELFFYAIFEKDIINKQFIYKDTDKIKDYRGIGYFLKSQFKSINAHFLATRLHPLIDDKMIKLINNDLSSYKIKFDYIKYDIDAECEKEFGKGNLLISLLSNK